MQNKDTDDRFEKRTGSGMCVPWFLLLELSGVPVCDSPQAFGKGKKPKSAHDYNRAGLKCAVWFLA